MANSKHIILAVITATLFLIAGCGGPGKYDVFAQCLADSGVTMYGAYWCPHCADQKELFGKSWKHVNYVECSLPNRAGQTPVCSAAGIEAYPTWEFADGERVTGLLSIRELSEKTGCSAEDSS